MPLTGCLLQTTTSSRRLSHTGRLRQFAVVLLLVGGKATKVVKLSRAVLGPSSPQQTGLDPVDGPYGSAYDFFHVEAHVIASRRLDRRGSGRCHGRVLSGPSSVHALGLSFFRSRRRSLPWTRPTACLHTCHTRADRGTVLHPGDAASDKFAGTEHERPIARGAGPGAFAGLPSDRRRRGRHLACRRARPLRQFRFPVSRPSIHRLLPGRFASRPSGPYAIQGARRISTSRFKDRPRACSPPSSTFPTCLTRTAGTEFFTMTSCYT